MPVSPRTRAENMPIKDKVAYVKSQGQTRKHHCHWVGCIKSVPPALWGCYLHWSRLPDYLRGLVWEAYRPGQEVDMSPSKEYVRIVRDVEEWIRKNYPCIACEGKGRSSSGEECIPCNGSGVRQ